MSLLDGIKNVVSKVVRQVQDFQDEMEQEEENRQLIEYWKKQFEADKRAKEPWNERFDQWEAEYSGSREFDNVKDVLRTQERQVRTIINFPRMVCEALLDLNVPDPNMQPVSPDDEQVVETLKAYVQYVTRATNPSLEQINLENERRVLKYGGAFWKVHWDNSIKRAGYVGDITISNPHPKDIIPNYAATSMEDLEHYHHVVNRTAKYILRKWKHLKLDDLEQKATLYKEFDEMIDSSKLINQHSQGENDKDSGLNKYTVIETTYKDEDGDICKLWWSGDLVIEHINKFFYRRDEEGNPTTTEILEPGTEIRRPDGTMYVLEDYAEVEYYVPKSWDLIYQPFIPRDKCFWGISIMEDIHDINEAIKKALYIEEESRLRGRKKIITDSEEDKQKLMDPYGEVIALRGTPQVVDFGEYDGIAWIEKLKEWMQLLTGTTNAALGVNDPNVKSGKQAQIYVEQANFKVAIKSAYKAVAYKYIYRTIVDFAMAFVDEDRPFRLEGERQQAEYGVFNRLNMLKDMSGNIIWPDIDIDVSADMGLLKSRADIFNNMVQLAGQGRFEPTPGNLILLKVLHKLGVPMLTDIIEEMEAQVQAQMQPQQPDVNAIIQQLPPEQQQMFMQLSPEEQQVMIQQVMGGM